MLYFGAKLIARLNRWMRGQLVSCLALCVLMCNGYIPAAACVIAAVLPLLDLDGISTAVIKISD